MDRCAVFVDVGYLYAAGGVLCAGTTTRSRLELDLPGIVAMLSTLASTNCAQPLLRTYWYDGAKNGIPTSHHLAAGLVDDVKVRLGRINSQGQQKGVDALIYRDLMTLARERAISHAYLVAGDGDLVEGVRAAQDLGTHVTLVHIQRAANNGTSPDLMQEADRRIELGASDLAPFICRAASAPANASAPLAPADAARKYASAWFATATDADVAAMTQAHPRIPPPIDAELMATVERDYGSPLRGHQHIRHTIRQAFWTELTTRVGARDATVD